jgi:hypothetical protein
MDRRLTRLYNNTSDQTSKELQSIAANFKPENRGRRGPTGFDAQKEGRIALVWRTVGTSKFKRSSQGATFDSKSDRLELALAIRTASRSQWRSGPMR